VRTHTIGSVIGAALAAALGASSPLADTQPRGLVATFIQLCGDAEGNAATALASADAAGWETPSSVATPPPQFGHWVDVKARLQHTTTGLRVLMVGTQSRPGGGLADSCSILDRDRGGGPGPDMRALREDLGAWIGAPPTQEGADFANYEYRIVAGARVSIAPSKDPMRAGAGPPSKDEVVVSFLDLALPGGLHWPMIQMLRWR
jgi:hypothetical protein